MPGDSKSRANRGAIMNNFASRQKIPAKMKNGIARIAKANDLDLVYLFGSFVTGTANPLSDLDVAVLLSKSFANDPFGTKRSHLVVEFAQLFKSDRVDLVILNTAPFSVSFTVVHEGVLLYATNEDFRVQFETTTILNYLDFQPFEEVYLLEMISQIHQKGGSEI